MSDSTPQGEIEPPSHYSLFAIYHLPTKLQEGNVCTPVCLFTGGVCNVTSCPAAWFHVPSEGMSAHESWWPPNGGCLPTMGCLPTRRDLPTTRILPTRSWGRGRCMALPSYDIQQRPSKWAVRILLECFLVKYCSLYVTYKM